MDEFNYRRLMQCAKRRCEESGATMYQDPQGVFRSIINDHERFETCYDCGHLVGWCPQPETCEQAIWKAEREAAQKAKRKRKRTAKAKPAKS